MKNVFAQPKNYLDVALLALVAFGLIVMSGCGGGSGGGSSGGGSDPHPILPPDPGDPVSLTIVSGRDYDCFTLNGVWANGQLWCRGSNASSGWSSASFEPIITHVSPIVEFKGYDDSFCFTASVAVRPFNAASSGIALYCIGEANLAGSFSGYPINFASPSFLPGDMSPEMDWTILPFMGGDLDMATHLGGTYMIDGLALVSEETLECEMTDVSTLTCPDFVVTE